MILVGVNERLLPFRSSNEDLTPKRLEEERRLMHLGITRARHTLAVGTLRRRKNGRDTIAGVPSRFIAEMKLDEVKKKEDPRARLKRLRDEVTARVAAAAAVK
ncbi:putative DNA helicase [Rubrivivax sp. A210]|nr:putative DNA helicase [Rubrivivax sp. A210]